MCAAARSIARGLVPCGHTIEHPKFMLKHLEEHGLGTLDGMTCRGIAGSATDELGKVVVVEPAGGQRRHGLDLATRRRRVRRVEWRRGAEASWPGRGTRGRRGHACWP